MAAELGARSGWADGMGIGAGEEKCADGGGDAHGAVKAGGGARVII